MLTGRLSPKNTMFPVAAVVVTELDGAGILARHLEICNLTSVDGAKVEVSLEVSANVPDGLPMSTVRVVMENCQTLKVKNYGIDT